MKIRKKNVQHGVKLAMRARAFISAVTFLSTLASTTDIYFSETASIAFNQQSSSLSTSAETEFTLTVTALMNVNDCEVRFQLDSAADVNTICKKFVRKDQVRPTSITLRMWNNSHHHYQRVLKRSSH
jgi:hypothetical protein